MRGQAVSSQRKLNHHWQSAKQLHTIIRLTVTSIGSGTIERPLRNFLFLSAEILQGRSDIRANHLKVTSSMLPLLLQAPGTTKGLVLASKAIYGSGWDYTLFGSFDLPMYQNNFLRFEEYTGSFNISTSKFRPQFCDSIATPVEKPTNLILANDNFTFTETQPSLVANGLFLAQPQSDFEYEIEFVTPQRLIFTGSLYSHHDFPFYSNEGDISGFLEQCVDKITFTIEVW